MTETLVSSELNNDELATKVEALVDVLQLQLEQVEDEKQLQAEEAEIKKEEAIQEQELLTEINTGLKDLASVLNEDNQNVINESASTNQLLESLLYEVTEMNVLLEEQSEVVEAGAGTLLTYGVVYVPLLIIIISGWWFFKQFIGRVY